MTIAKLSFKNKKKRKGHFAVIGGSKSAEQRDLWIKKKGICSLYSIPFEPQEVKYNTVHGICQT